MDAFFRIAVAALFVASLAIVLRYRVRAARGNEPISRCGEGLALLISIRLSGLVLLVSTLLYLVAPEALAWAQLPLPFAIRAAGAVIGVVALVLLGWTLRTLGPNLTDTVAVRRQHTLVTSGPYRYIRHPYYSTTLLLVVATALMAANVWLAVAGFAVFGLLALRTPREELALRERFGRRYERYMRRTPRYVPRWRK